MAEPIRVFVKRKLSPALSDVSLVYIKNFNTEFGMELWQQIGSKPPVKVHSHQFQPVQVTPPPPPPPVTGLTLVYDSNVQGRWANGVVRKGKKDGEIGANGMGLYTAASGDPIFEIDGKGVCKLITEGGDDGVSHGRIYKAVCNYRGVYQTDFNMLTKTITSYTQKVASMHQANNWAGNDVPCEKRFGGIGNGFDTASVECKTESCHNEHDNEDKIGEKLAKKLAYGEWYTSRFTYNDIKVGNATHIYQKTELKYPGASDFVTVCEGAHEHPKPYYLDKPMYMKRSEIWDRINGFGELLLRNQKVWLYN